MPCLNLNQKKIIKKEVNITKSFYEILYKQSNNRSTQNKLDVIRTFDLKLQHTFSISRKSINTQPVIVNQKDSQVLRSSNPYYNINIETITTDLRKN
jgi:hypothetical protein